MENIIIEGTRDTYFIPTVDFNAETGKCKISGESFLEDTIEFYTPLMKWIEKYTLEQKKPIEFEIKLSYFNSSTSRCILDILNILKDYEEEGGKIQVNWHYDKNDVDMEEDIEDYIADTGLDINLIPFQKFD